MTQMIAIAGKGGVGKTTCAALLLRALAAAGVRPLLAVDADPNANLHLLLGLSAPIALGSLREELLAAPGGATTKEALLEAMVQQRVAEGKDVDLITMGRGEWPGCYCYVNDLLRRSLSRLSGGYEAAVDNMGMEYLPGQPVPDRPLVARPFGDSAARIWDLATSDPACPAWLLSTPYSAGWSEALTPDPASSRYRTTALPSG
jgi:hypothetical protein